MWYASSVPELETQNSETIEIPFEEAMPEYRVLVCGDRNWTNYSAIVDLLRRLQTTLREFSPKIRLVVVEGEARGADRLGKVAARELGADVEKHPAQWSKFGRAAGPIRNQEMLDSGLHFALAFHHNLEESKGTADMVKRLKKAGIPVVVIG
jgi:hypothetical protein